MSDLRRLAAGVLLPGFTGTEAPRWLAGLLERGLAGVCLFGHNVRDDAQVRRLTEQVHGCRGEALVASDEEGGTVTRLDAGPGSPWPGHGTLGALDDPDATRRVAAGMGRRLRAAGIDLALAPVLDVNSEADNPVIGVRSFGATADLVSRHGVAFVRGLHDGGVLACAKHFPGHGATRVDSHVALPVLEESLAEIAARDLPPFAAAAGAGVACVMTAHVVVRALDPRPATTSPAVIALLRETVGFDGVVLSDALDMRAVAGDRAGSVAADALAAGVDLLCLGNPAFPEPYDDESRVEQVLDEIVAAVEAGRLSVDRLTDAAGRVAGLRVPAPATGGPPAPVDGHEVAARALRVTGDVAVLRPAQVLVARPDVAMASGRRESEVARTLAARRPDWPVIEVDDATDVARALRHARHLGVVMLAEGRTDARTAAVVRAVLADRPDAVVVHGGAAGSPDLADRQIRTFGGGRAVAEAVVDRLLAGGDRRR